MNMSDIPKRTAWIYSNKDTGRASEEGQHFAEVIANPGEDAEITLFTTGWHTSPHPAINEAEAWMKANEVEETED